jgi:hypothetical protein
MSIVGRVPKDEDERINRNAPAFSPTEIKADGKLRGTPLPPLPMIRGVKQEWCKATKKWWDDYRRSPQAKLMQVTDWNVLYAAALVHNIIWSDRNKEISYPALNLLLSELRRREDAVGGTFEARAKLRITVLTEQTEDEHEASITEAAEELVNYAERLNKKVAKK